MAKLDRVGALAAAAALILAACGSAGGQKAAGSSSSIVPSTTGMGPIPVTPSSLLLGGADLAGYSATSQPVLTPVPCGSRFGDASSSTTQAAVAFATSGSQQTVNETVALYPSAAAAAAVADAFRTAGPSCSDFDDTHGPTTTYQVRSVTPPAVTADDAVAVSLASPAHFYDLVLLRSGARIAWLALGQVGNPVDPDVLQSVATAASERLGS
ncbi:MAG TPA: hypothetical protein VGH66_09120 [Acidimicrobiales bacterium]|jgi:hypothetical protein